MSGVGGRGARRRRGRGRSGGEVGVGVAAALQAATSEDQRRGPTAARRTGLRDTGWDLRGSGGAAHRSPTRRRSTRTTTRYRLTPISAIVASVANMSGMSNRDAAGEVDQDAEALARRRPTRRRSRRRRRASRRPASRRGSPAARPGPRAGDDLPPVARKLRAISSSRGSTDRMPDHRRDGDREEHDQRADHDLATTARCRTTGRRAAPARGSASPGRRRGRGSGAARRGASARAARRRRARCARPTAKPSTISTSVCATCGHIVPSAQARTNRSTTVHGPGRTNDGSRTRTRRPATPGRTRRGSGRPARRGRRRAGAGAPAGRRAVRQASRRSDGCRSCVVLGPERVEPGGGSGRRVGMARPILRAGAGGDGGAGLLHRDRVVRHVHEVGAHLGGHRRDDGRSRGRRRAGGAAARRRSRPRSGPGAATSRSRDRRGTRPPGSNGSPARSSSRCAPRAAAAPR